MADVVSSAQRSRMMAGIRGANTTPERFVRSMLHKEGLRFRLHDRKLPGKPDIVLPRWRTVVLVHGCFWHGHNCHLFKLPGTRRDFWRSKIEGNRTNDSRTINMLKRAGWKVAIIWECALKGRARLHPRAVQRRLAAFVRSDRRRSLELFGQSNR